MSSSERTGRIDFISSYCDSRCERCLFTMRCSAYLTRAAIEMCGGDVREGFELALGEPQPVVGTTRAVPAEWLECLGGDDVSADESEDPEGC